MELAAHEELQRNKISPENNDPWSFVIFIRDYYGHEIKKFAMVCTCNTHEIILKENEELE
jgi:hypothetical protein